VRSLGEFEGLASGESHNRFFPICGVPRCGSPLATGFAEMVRGIYRNHLLAEQLLDSLPDLDFVGMDSDFKDVFVKALRKKRRFFRQTDVPNDL